MNIFPPEAAPAWLFLDINAFFASCEQQDVPALRGKPIVVVQTAGETACVIAASYEAKRRGVRTGMMVRDARRLCPDVIPVKSRHRLYTNFHERILKAVDTCLPIEKVLSIDEMACRLIGRERQVPAARDLDLKLKRALREQVGECIRCSIGIAPNIFLGKVGSDIQKPDGLVVITARNMPDVMLHMDLQDIYGIGPRMKQRLNNGGIYTVADLWNASPYRLRRVWGGVHGALFYQMLHGADIQPPSARHAKSMGHQHVLEPELRNREDARAFAQHLLAKAAERLRRNDYYCRRLGLHLSWQRELGKWWGETGFHETHDTNFLLARLEDLWAGVPRFKPRTVSVLLFGLVPAIHHQPDLFGQSARQNKLSPLVDSINNRYGRNAIGFGLLHAKIRAFKGHAAFQRVPESWEF
ncbi:MAG: hypothetical protein AB7H77_06310 [Bdellovibrionales bacterium]